ncbi:unnamed protein product [marine sediment metagenome]|uniref:Uncharacterized protein n=1 Tax=marine sediment metagenome TaxID=412755 RepID=X1T5W2_9ZZZZ
MVTKTVVKKPQRKYIDLMVKCPRCGKVQHFYVYSLDEKEWFKCNGFLEPVTPIAKDQFPFDFVANKGGDRTDCCYGVFELLVELLIELSRYSYLRDLDAVRVNVS